MKKSLTLISLSLALSAGGAWGASHTGAPMSGKASDTASAPVARSAAGSCETKAADKKLAGAAKTSFVKKCESDASVATCETEAADKKLAGAAKTSFVKKCQADATARK